LILGIHFYVTPDGMTQLSTCMGYGKTVGIILLIIGTILPCCYCFCFIALGEVGRKLIGVKSLPEVPAQ